MYQMSFKTTATISNNSNNRIKTSWNLYLDYYDKKYDTHYFKTKRHLRGACSGKTLVIFVKRYILDFWLGSELQAFYKQRIFQLFFQCLLNFLVNWASNLLRRCLIHVSIIIPKHFLYLLYLCPWLDAGLFMSYLCDLFFIFIFIFTDIILLLLIF